MPYRSQKQCSFALITHHNFMVKPYWWRYCTLWTQDMEKSISSDKEASFLVASLNHAGKCCSACWRRQDMNHLTLHAVILNCQAKYVHWYTNCTTYWLIYLFLIGFVTCYTGENFLSGYRKHGWGGHRPQGRTCSCYFAKWLSCQIAI